MKTQPWIGVAVVITVALSLAACKSRGRTGCNDCAPPATMAQQPAYGDIVDGEVWSDSGTGSPDANPSISAFPPAPGVPSDPAITQADLDAANDRGDEEARRREAAEAQIRAERDRLAAAASELEAARAKIDQLENAPTGTFDTEEPELPAQSPAERLAEDLQSSGGADVIRDGNLVIVRMTNSFRAGSDVLKQDRELISTLSTTASALSSYPGASVSVVGHSDSDPIKRTKNKWRDNDQLSLARAQRVASVLASSGVDSNRISIDGRGAREPLVAPERSRADKARNRRVEIMIRL